jgi:hypothetical protein
MGRGAAAAGNGRTFGAFEEVFAARAIVGAGFLLVLETAPGLMARRVVVGDSRSRSPSTGSISLTFSMASSKASISATESSIRAIVLVGERVIIASMNESSFWCSISLAAFTGERVVISPTNEPSFCP